jgi:polyphosphate kinase
MDILQIQMDDNVKARLVNVKDNNSYRKTDTETPIRSQIKIYEYLKKL